MGNVASFRPEEGVLEKLQLRPTRACVKGIIARTTAVFIVRGWVYRREIIEEESIPTEYELRAPRYISGIRIEQFDMPTVLISVPAIPFVSCHRESIVPMCRSPNR
jgi:hypothetical protein